MTAVLLADRVRSCNCALLRWVIGVVTGAVTGVVTGVATGVVIGVVTGVVTGAVTGAVTGVVTGVVTCHCCCWCRRRLSSRYYWISTRNQHVVSSYIYN